MHAQVVVVGGGPAGAWLALELRLGGIEVVVVEQEVEIPQMVRGVTIHPRTAELLEMRGLLGPLLAEGVRIPGASFGQIPGIVDYGSLDTDYQYVLAVPQHRTNELLLNRAQDLGADVRRGHRVTAVEQGADQVRASVAGPAGEYVITCDYLVGCDGTQSLVRRSVGIDFPGADADVLSFGGDVHCDNPPETIPFQHWGSSGSLLIFRIPGDVYRFAGIAPEDVGGQLPAELSFEEFRQKVIRMVGHDFGMRDPRRITFVGNASRQAVRYREGRVLLAGDSAHRHYPAGGMGMNVGVQDAVNLGWKLAATLNGWAPPGLLDSYSTERHPVGSDLLEFTRAQTAAIISFSSDGQGLRSLLGTMIAELPEFKHALALRYSGLKVEYSAVEGDHELVGKRAPNLRFTGTADRLYALFAEAKYVLLDLRPDRAQGLDAGFDQIRPAVRDLDPADRRGAWSDVTAALLRPDGHVAWATTEIEAPRVRRQLADAVRRLHAEPANTLAVTPWHRQPAQEEHHMLEETR